MTKPALGKDDYGEVIQGALCPKTAHSVSLSGTTAKNTVAFTYRVLRVVSTEDCFIKLGGSTVEASATDHFLPADVVEYFLRDSHTYLAGIVASGTATLYISEMG